MMVFEFPYSITTSCLDVVYTGWHQFINKTVNQDVTESRWNDCFYSLLSQCALVVISKITAKRNGENKCAVIVNNRIASILCVPFYIHAVGLAIFDQGIYQFIESRSFISRFTIKGLAIDAVYQFLKLLLVKFFGGMGRIFTPSPILFPNHVAIQISPKGIENSGVKFILRLLHHYKFWFLYQRPAPKSSPLKQTSFSPLLKNCQRAQIH